jgi:chromate reductase, NAD(P)H dehydrogenase (quinone)
MSASQGALRGFRGLVHLRALLGNLGVLVLPYQVTVLAAHSAFDDNKSILDEHETKHRWLD